VVTTEGYFIAEANSQPTTLISLTNAWITFL